MSSDTLTPDKIKNVLIIGIGGGLAQITAHLLHKTLPNAYITGVDSRDLGSLTPPSRVTYKQVKYNRSQFEKIFREVHYDVVLHLGRLSHAGNSPEQVIRRLDMNIIGTQRILDLALQSQVKKIIVLSTYHVYGALSDNPVFLTEEAPLRASIRYPELRDVTTMDQLTTSWLWKNRDKIETVLLRPCNIVGPQIKNAISTYLRSSFVPLPIDYNPMFQFINEFDMANIIAHSISHVPTGIYNVASDEFISIQEAKKMMRTTNIPASIWLLKPAAQMIKNLWVFPDYLLEYLKYACLIDNKNIKKYLPDDFFRFSIKESLDLLR